MTGFVGGGPADWSVLYSQFMARSTAQSARTLRLYQEVLERVSRGELPPTVFQDHYARFAQAHGAEYSRKLYELGAAFLTGLVRIGAIYSEDAGELAAPGISPDPNQWSWQLSEYAGRLNARAMKAYRAQLDRVAAGEISPEELQRTASESMSRKLPGYLEQAGHLYFDLLNGLNEIRAQYEDAYFLELLEKEEKEPPVVLHMKAPLGEVASASLSVSNTTDAPATIRCSASDVRRSDGVGPAFAPQISIASDNIELGPGEEGTLRLSLPLEAGTYDAGADYAGTLFISGQGDVPVEVQLRITASEAR
ncbi:MAG TPA: hypothetical protein VEF06_08155 [Bryobacteraceae bacterium]|nr:hypothetical protein [Bryobacteraceae bacterium]